MPTNAERRAMAMEAIDAVRSIIDPQGACDDVEVVGDLLADLAHLYGPERLMRMASNAAAHCDAERDEE